MLERVLCPDDLCDKQMNESAEFFKSLPTKTRNQYKKNKTFFAIENDPNLKMCPNEKCNEGFVKLNTKDNPECQFCHKKLCKKCLSE